MHPFWAGSIDRSDMRGAPRASARRTLPIWRSLKLLACLAAMVMADAAVIAGASLGLIDLSQRALIAAHNQAIAAVAAIAQHPISPHTAASMPVSSILTSTAEDPHPLAGSRVATLFEKDPSLEAPAEPPAPPPVWTPKVPGAPGWYGPGACVQSELAAPIGTRHLTWPAGSHTVSGYTYSAWHPGIDVTALYGTPIYAIDTGVVVYAGWNYTGYGDFVIVDHGDGQWSAYAHLSQILVECSAILTQGQLIGLAGATGNATGSHLHFEVFETGLGQVNPWPRLP